MPITSTSTNHRSSFAGGPVIAERARGTAHPASSAMRDRVARSLLLRPDARTGHGARR